MEAKNIAAFATVTTLALATAGSAVAAATTAATVATVAYSILAVTFAGLSFASITAWISPDSKDVETYFQSMSNHAGYAIAGMYQLVAQTLVQALVQGIGKGVENAISRKIGGADHTYQRVG